MTNLDAIMNSLKTNYAKLEQSDKVDIKSMGLNTDEQSIFEEYDLPVGYNQGDGNLDFNEIDTVLKDYEDDQKLNGGQTKTDSSQYQESFLTKLAGSVQDLADTKETTAENSKAESKGEYSSSASKVTVDKWGKGDNDCLSKIVKNNYGVNPYSKEGKEIMQAVMESNPEIYANGRQGIINGKVADVEKNSTETILYTGENVNLPKYQNNGDGSYQIEKTDSEGNVTQRTHIKKNEQGEVEEKSIRNFNEDGSSQKTTYDKEGRSTYFEKTDADGNVVESTTREYNEDGTSTKKIYDADGNVTEEYKLSKDGEKIEE